MNEKAKKYIINMINTQAQVLPCLSFKYEYDASGATHIVDVEGKEDCLASDSWQDFVYDSVSNFEEIFGGESLLFVSSDSLIRADESNLLHKVDAKVLPPKKQLGSDWLTLRDEQAKEKASTYKPKVDIPKGKVRKKTDFSYNFSPPIEPALTNVKAGFFC